MYSEKLQRPLTKDSAEGKDLIKSFMGFYVLFFFVCLFVSDLLVA